MSMDEVSTKHVERGYQRPVVHPGWAFAAFGAVVLMVSLVLVVVWLIQERLYGGNFTSLSSAEDVTDTIPAPRLQSSPARDLAILQARSAAILDGYGWIDRSQGIVHIPIDRAMQLVMERGLEQPFQDAAAVSASPPPGAPGTTGSSSDQETGTIHAPEQEPTVDKEEPPSLGGPWPPPGEESPQ